MSFFNAWFHGLDLNLLKPPGGKPFTIAQFATGAVGVVVVAFPAGLVLAATYDLLMARNKAAPKLPDGTPQPLLALVSVLH